MPSRVPMNTCSLPSVISTAITESPSSTPIAMMPPARGLLNARQVGLLDHALARAHDDELLVLVGRPFLDGEERRDLLAFLHRHEVGDGLALAARTDVGNLVHAQPVGAAAVRENHDVGVRRGDEEVADEVLFARAHADAALAATALHAVGRDRRPLDVAGVGDRDRHVLVGDQIFDAELAALLDDDRSALVASSCRARP